MKDFDDIKMHGTKKKLLKNWSCKFAATLAPFDLTILQSLRALPEYEI
jgi:hypothetical protein